MKVEPVDGYFGENVIVFEGLHRGGFIARGFEITAPDLENADPVHHNALESDLIALLTVLKPGQRMQVQWDVGGSYRAALLRYRAKTNELATNPWTQRVRNEIFVRAWEMDQSGALRRERLRLYFTMPVDAGAFAGSRSTAALLSAYQRPEVLNHIKEIRSYLEDAANPMIPNAIVVAFNDSVKFSALETKGTAGPGRVGLLKIPTPEDPAEDKPGWIVDGQQRTAASLRSPRNSRGTEEG